MSPGDYSSNYNIIEEIFRLCWFEYIINVNLITRIKNSTTAIYTYQPFNEKKCNDTTPIVHYEYRNFMMERNDVKFYPDKTKDMHKCPVIVATFPNEPFTILKKQRTGLYKLDGFEGEMLSELAEIFNFSTHIHYEKGKWGLIELINGAIRANGSVGRIMNREANITIGAYAMKHLNALYLEPTYSHIQSKIVFVIPPGRPFTSLEKLLRPFELTLWLLLLIIFVCGFIFINLIKYFDQTIQNILIGHRNTMPFLDMIGIFFGCASNFLSGGNFARMLCMTWILTSLILRTIYQGCLFHFLQVEANHSVVDTVAQVIASKYKIGASIGDKEWFVDDAELLARIYLLKVHSHDYVWEKVRHHDTDFVLTTTKFHAEYANSVNFSRGVLMVTKDSFREVSICTYLPKGSYLARPFSLAISHLISSGLIDNWKNKYVNEKLKYNRYDTDEPHQLKYLHIRGCVQLCLALYVLSIIVFVLEILTKYSKKLRKIVNFFTY